MNLKINNNWVTGNPIYKSKFEWTYDLTKIVKGIISKYVIIITYIYF